MTEKIADEIVRHARSLCIRFFSDNNEHALADYLTKYTSGYYGAQVGVRLRSIKNVISHGRYFRAKDGRNVRPSRSLAREKKLLGN